MKRFFTDYLIEWKDRESRKPLIVRGARQVGKTYTIEEFGKNHFSNIIKINFEETFEIKDIFNTNNIDDIIQSIEIYFNQKITEKETLLFFDEIQVCPEAIVSLRYFYEKKPDLHIIAAGSLLDFTLNDLKYSMPVGRIEFAYMYPMNFYEFLLALDENLLYEYLKQYKIGQEINKTVHEKALGLLRLYFIVGGMPEAVKTYVQNKNLIDVERIHESIIKSLEFDFAKYSTKNQQYILVRLLRYIPKVIGNKFKYSNFDNSIRADKIKKSLELLEMSRLVYLIYKSSAGSLPLDYSVNNKIFKPLFLDIGLSNHILKLDILKLKDLVLANEGSLAEQFTGQQLITTGPFYKEKNLYYWLREKRNAEAEVDYIIQVGNKIVPVEVKAGKTGKLKSLQVFMFEKHLSTAIRINSDLPSSVQVQTKIKIENKLQSISFKLISIPLYLVLEIERLLNSKK